MQYVKKFLLNIYNICSKVNKIFRKDKKPKILLYCSSSTMEKHILDYYMCLENKENYNLFLYYKTNFLNKDVHLIKKYYLLFFKYFDLFISPDVDMPFIFQKTSSIFINHGLHIVKSHNQKVLYTYGQDCINLYGQSKYTKFFEPNLRIAKEIQNDYPIFKDKIIYTGYKFAQNIKDSMRQKNKYRKSLNINNNQILICVFSTWGIESLFHKVGPSLIEQAKKLIDTNEYCFILSNHPKEYTNYSKTIVSTGKFVDDQNKNGFIIRKPGEDFIPYLVASDIVISDYSSMSEIAILADKPIILSNFNDDIISPYSLVYRMKKEVPIFNADDSLLSKINEAKNFHQSNLYKSFSDEIYIEHSKYEQIVRKTTDSLLNGGMTNEKK